MIGGNEYILASTPIVQSQLPSQTKITFSPTSSEVKVKFKYGTSAWTWHGHSICISKPVMVSETYYVDVCDGGEDKYRFGFNGQEKDNEMKGIGNSLDFGARIYDSRVGRWMSVDPLQAKYPSFTPYNFVANSPMIFIDPDGKEIIVAEKYQDKFSSSLKSVFGDKAENFIYDERGKLIFNGNVLDFNRKERRIYKRLNKIIESEDITNIIYEESYQISDVNNKLYTFYASEAGGEITILKNENQEFNENYIIIDPDVTSFKVNVVTPNYYKHKNNKTVPSIGEEAVFIEEQVNGNFKISTWHALGHVLYGGKKQHKVIKFDNKIRKMMIPPLPKRKFDEHHNRKVRKTSGAIDEHE